MTAQPQRQMSPAYWAHIKALVAAAPPLTASQRDIVRRTLRPVVNSIAAERLGRAS